MYETREVTLTLRLPPDIADQAIEVNKTDPEFLERVVQYGITRRAIYRSIRDRKQEPKVSVDVTPGGVVRTRYDFDPPIDPTKVAENRHHDGGAWADKARAPHPEMEGEEYAPGT